MHTRQFLRKLDRLLWKLSERLVSGDGTGTESVWKCV